MICRDHRKFCCFFSFSKHARTGSCVITVKRGERLEGGGISCMQTESMDLDLTSRHVSLWFTFVMNKKTQSHQPNREIWVKYHQTILCDFFSILSSKRSRFLWKSLEKQRLYGTKAAELQPCPAGDVEQRVCALWSARGCTWDKMSELSTITVGVCFFFSLPCRF